MLHLTTIYTESMHISRPGLALGISAYSIWGIFPFYFGLIAIVSPLEVVPWRVLATLLFCLIAVSVARRWSQIITVLKQPRLIGWFIVSGLLLYANWQIFIYGVMTGHVLQTSLGYFINPLVTILIGVIVRREQLTRLQWSAVGIAAAGVTAVAIGYGKFPWIALGLAFSFGIYGAVHKHVGDVVDGLSGLTVETMLTLPVAIIQFVLVATTAGITAHTHGTWIFVLVLFSGVMTAIPLILFGEAASRLPLSYLGFIQFLTPILSFLYGYVVAGEEISPARWIGFAAVWIALIMLILDMVRQIRQAPAGKQVGIETGPIPLD